MNACPVCDENMSHAFTATVLARHKVSYLHCANCGLVRTEKPYWLEEAYGSAIAIADTGLVQRNLSISAKLAVLLYLCFDRTRPYVDVAGGYGMLTRLMRDLGFDFYWTDKYCENILAKGFEADDRIQSAAAITAFEVLEHLENPLDFVSSAMRSYASDTLIVTTETYAGGSPPPTTWWYYSFETGQHIAFYQEKTLRKMAERLGLNFFTAGGLRIFSKKLPKARSLARLLCGRASLPLALLVRRRMGSRTFPDHKELLVSAIQGDPGSVGRR